ncbi:MAG: ABC transporter permease [Planctomycetaceae bacterium]|nr:ABC transporter permease [Planctomycetaceae bacterium]
MNAIVKNHDATPGWKKGDVFRKFSAFFGLILLCLILTLLSDAFLKTTNIRNILSQVAVISVMAAGATFVILTGGIDLSVGSILGLCGVLAAGVLKWSGSPALAIAACLFVGLACGVANGYLVSFLKLPPFVATLGIMSIARGFSFIYTQGKPISSFPPSFRYLGTGEFFGVPVLVIVTAIVYIASWYILRKTPFGRYVHAIGSNETATRLSGIHTNLNKALAYVICGGLCGFAALLFCGRINSAHPLSGQGYELNAIAAVVIGGTSLSGGRGSVGGTLIGALIMGVITNGLNLLNVDTYWQGVVLGVVIIIAVTIDMRSKKGAA